MACGVWRRAWILELGRCWASPVTSQRLLFSSFQVQMIVLPLGNKWVMNAKLLERCLPHHKALFSSTYNSLLCICHCARCQRYKEESALSAPCCSVPPHHPSLSPEAPDAMDGLTALFRALGLSCNSGATGKVPNDVLLHRES